MSSNEHILVSLEQRHADNIFAGSKRVELRRRRMNVEPGATMWIYVKQPIGSILGSARIQSVHSHAPSTLWRKFGHVSGLTRAEFFEYFKGVRLGVALVLDDSSRLGRSVSLDEIRHRKQTFQPPQFFARLDNRHPVREVVNAELD